MAKDKLKVFKTLQSDLRAELAELEQRASDIRRVLDGGEAGNGRRMDGKIPSPKRGRPAKVKRHSTGRKITTNDAIATALAGGVLSVPEIVAKVTEIKGKVSKASINQGLMQLKQKKAILNPSRGKYSLKK